MFDCHCCQVEHEPDVYIDGGLVRGILGCMNHSTDDECNVVQGKISLLSHSISIMSVLIAFPVDCIYV